MRTRDYPFIEFSYCIIGEEKILQTRVLMLQVNILLLMRNLLKPTECNIEVLSLQKQHHDQS